MNRSTRLRTDCQRSPAPNVSVATRNVPRVPPTVASSQDADHETTEAAAGAGRGTGSRSRITPGEGRVWVRRHRRLGARSRSGSSVGQSSTDVRPAGRHRSWHHPGKVAAHAAPSPAAPTVARPAPRSVPRGPLRAQPPHPRPHRPAAVGPRGRRAPDDQPPRAGVRGDARPDPERHEAVLRHDLNDVAMLTTAGQRRARGGHREHPVAGRPRPRRDDRLVRRPVREDRRDLRRERHKLDVEWGQAGRPDGGPRAPARHARPRRPSC